MARLLIWYTRRLFDARNQHVQLSCTSICTIKYLHHAGRKYLYLLCRCIYHIRKVGNEWTCAYFCSTGTRLISQCNWHIYWCQFIPPVCSLHFYCTCLAKVSCTNIALWLCLFNIERDTGLSTAYLFYIYIR